MKKNIICIIINVIIGTFIAYFLGITTYWLFWVGVILGGCEALFLYYEGDEK